MSERYKDIPEPGFQEALHQRVGEYFMQQPQGGTVFCEGRLFHEFPDVDQNPVLLDTIRKVAWTIYNQQVKGQWKKF